MRPSPLATDNRRLACVQLGHAPALSSLRSSRINHLQSKMSTFSRFLSAASPSPPQHRLSSPPHSRLATDIRNSRSTSSRFPFRINHLAPGTGVSARVGSARRNQFEATSRRRCASVAASAASKETKRRDPPPTPVGEPSQASALAGSAGLGPALNKKLSGAVARPLGPLSVCERGRRTGLAQLKPGRVSRAPALIIGP